MINSILNKSDRINLDDLLDVSTKLLTKMLDYLPIAANSILENKNPDKSLIFISNNLELFVQIVIELHRSFHTDEKIKMESTTDIKNLKIHLLSIIKAIYSAKQKNDEIMLCDLIEYELKDNLTQWKINIIPSIRKNVKL